MPNIEYLKSSLEESRGHAREYQRLACESDTVDSGTLGRWLYWQSLVEQTEKSLAVLQRPVVGGDRRIPVSPDIRVTMPEGE